MIGREFAHIHPHPDSGSMHVKLPADEAQHVIETGWGENHYFVTQGVYLLGLIMVFSPREAVELAVVQQIVMRSYEFATAMN